MAAAEGKTCFLIDGFPRNLDNVTGWEEHVGDKASVEGVLFYDATAEELEKRLLGRQEGREDDQIDVIKKRFTTYMSETMPIVDLYKEKNQVIHINGMRSIEEVWEDTKKHIEEVQARKPPKVLFVLGGPGAGKGTQCAKIVENFPGWAHISAGDCLRAERNDPASEDGAIINERIKEGKIVPVAITVKLLIKAMAAAEGKNCFLIDGYPRNLDNVTGWKEHVGHKAKVEGVLFYDATEEELERRLLGRQDGRDDDQIDVIKKRFTTYMIDTMPIVDLYKENNQVIQINGMRSIEEVWEDTKKHIVEVEARP